MTSEAVFLEATDRLLNGDYEAGFREYECRWHTEHFKPFLRHLGRLQWTGQPLDGKRLYLWHEQGFGDSIMMYRYVKELSQRCAVFLNIQKPLATLFSANTSAMITDEHGYHNCDYHCPLMSLPYAFKTRTDTIPIPAMMRSAKPYLGEISSDLNVGFQWAGNINHPEDQARSIPWEQFERLTRIKRIKFWGLQRNIRPTELPAVERSGHTFLWFDGFDMLAAIVAKMDLIVTVDSALAHLAGAMGKPAWVLIQANPDWRWMLHKMDTPWYPSLRLFRQRRPDNWKPVLDHVVELLRRRRG